MRGRIALWVGACVLCMVGRQSPNDGSVLEGCGNLFKDSSG